MRCLITGDDGFLGANLAKRLLADGHEVTGAALNRKGLTSLDALGVNCRVEYGDICDREYVERIVNASEAEWIFHLAAVSIVRIANANPARAIRTNVLGTLNVCEAAKGRRVVVASSDKAYGDQHGNVYHEDMDLRPTGAYELSKAQADQIARLYGAVVTRCANLYGPGDLNWSRLVPNSIRRALRGEAPVVHAGAADMRREWLYVGDAVSAYILLAEKGQAGHAYNVGSGQLAQTFSLANMIASLARAPMPVSGPRVGCYEIPAQELCSDKLRALGWEAETDMYAGICQTLEWYRQYLHVRQEVPV